MKQKNKSSKYVLIGTGVVAVLAGGYFALKWYQKRKLQEGQSFETFDTQDSQITIPSSHSPQSFSMDTFPIQRGRKGTVVKELQRALIKKYGSSILPKYGADGIWGSELSHGLLSKGYPDKIDFSTFLKIVSTKSSDSKTTIDFAQIAIRLKNGILRRNAKEILETLRSIENVEQYNQVNSEFKQFRVMGVRQTIVNASLSILPNDHFKSQVREELRRIGLKFDGVRWQLAGFDLPKVISIRSTLVFDEQENSLMIPIGTVIGRELQARDGISTIRTIDDRIVFTDSSNLKQVI